MLRWFGHIDRMKVDQITKQTYEGRMRGRERLRKSQLDGINEILKKRFLKNKQ